MRGHLCLEFLLHPPWEPDTHGNSGRWKASRPWVMLRLSGSVFVSLTPCHHGHPSLSWSSVPIHVFRLSPSLTRKVWRHPSRHRLPKWNSLESKHWLPVNGPRRFSTTWANKQTTTDQLINSFLDAAITLFFLLFNLIYNTIKSLKFLFL